MARRKPRDRRIRKLYELAINALASEKCFFCEKPLLEYWLTAKGPTDGYLRWLSEFTKESIFKVTVHHRNENRDDNTKHNRKWCHQSCHKSFHMKEGHKKGRYSNGD